MADTASPAQAPARRKAIIVGISGCSSSGKTTLARLLRDLFPGSFILHEDDFYKPDDEIPIGVDGLADWDCPEALDVPQMAEALAYIRANGALPANLVSKEDKNDVGACPVSDAALAAARARVQAWLQPGQPGHYLVANDANDADAKASPPPPPRICFLDGFLLYCPQLRAVMDQIDVRLFLRVSRARATQRRAARSGYVTLEGFWQDPPDYMEKIVWPNYVAAHRWLFGDDKDDKDGDGDVEGPPNAAVLAAHRILTQTNRGPDVDMETTLAWTVDTLLAQLGQA